MTRSKKPASKTLPPPTPSEAAFERVLESFEGPPAPRGSSSDRPRNDLQADRPRNNVHEFVEQMFARRKKFAERDDFAGIGDRETFPTKIMGVSFEGRQDIVAGLRPGLELELQRQPDNAVDANAIAVYYGALHLGFLRKEIAKHLAPLIDGGTGYRAQIEHITGGTAGKNFGVNVRVYRDAQPQLDAFAVQSRAHADRAAVQRALIGDAALHKAQRQTLERIDRGKNTLAVMGTGRGKSFCFQFPAAYRALESERKTLVLYPLRALANDQFEALKRRLGNFGLRIHRANGAISSDERAVLMRALEEGAWDIILATPEFLQFHREAFTGRSAPSLLVIDEVHHLYESSHRPAYQQLGSMLAALGNPQILGLTATARDEAFAHMVRELRIESWVIDPFVRTNLSVIDARGTRDKIGYLRDLFEDGGKAIVYCNSRNEAGKVADTLRKDFRNEVMFYHAGMPAMERATVEEYFRSSALRIVVATSAFGEGIDLPDVRHVVLYHLNFAFTEFNQQSGRAGRDGEPAQIHLLFGEADRRLNEFIIDQESPTLAVLREIYRSLRALSKTGTVRLSPGEIATALDLEKVNQRTVSVALRIFEDEGLLQTGIDDDGRYFRLVPVAEKVDLTKNERFAEGEAEREDFARFCAFVLSAPAQTLERIINRPIYPQGEALLR